MLKLGLTGNIASGKSFVESIFIQEGISCIDSDKIVHDLLAYDDFVISKVYSLFENLDILNEKGKINRQKLGSIVFKDKEKLKALELILHPIVKDKINRFFSDNYDKKLAVAVVPLLFEANMADMFDKIIIVGVDSATQIQRLMKRNNFTEEEALLRIKSQISQEEKIKKADFILWNNGSLEELTTLAKNLINELLNA
ncbi:MAG: dephospho-CoA kinase [bacterium]